VGGKTRADLIAMWLRVDHLFVDEVSMLGCYLILQIHEALVIAKGCTEPFGGVNVLNVAVLVTVGIFFCSI